MVLRHHPSFPFSVQQETYSDVWGWQQSYNSTFFMPVMWITDYKAWKMVANGSMERWQEVQFEKQITGFRILLNKTAFAVACTHSSLEAAFLGQFQYRYLTSSCHEQDSFCALPVCLALAPNLQGEGVVVQGKRKVAWWQYVHGTWKKKQKKHENFDWFHSVLYATLF